MWEKSLRDATSLARERVLSCLQNEPGCMEITGVGAGGDETKRFDQVAEQAIIDSLKNQLSFTLISEEAGEQQIGTSPGGYVILDPIDGSTNLSHNLPFACISAAFCNKPELESTKVAVVLEVYSGACFHAIQGRGAYCDESRIRPAETKPLEKCLIGVDDEFPPKLVASKQQSARRLGSTRHLGSNALELCYVAAGKIDAFIDLRGTFRGVDLAASQLILKEAGAVLIDQKEKPITGKCTNEAKYSFLAASSLRLARELLKLIE
jgi:myo-inositol-1(or 4)-monophosphatase